MGGKDPTLGNFLDLLSCDQRRDIVLLLIKALELSKLKKILAQESAEARNYFEKLKKFTEEKGNEIISPENKTTGSEDDFSESDDEDDPETDQSKWTPKFRDNFFEKFPETMNILILGETGVGKSTFINGLANYIRFNNIYDAKDQFEILIRAYFTVSEADYTQRKIVCEPTVLSEREGENENMEDGQSSTQSPKSYLIPFGPDNARKTIRIIDTPGIGDVRGIKEDKKNFAKILDFVAQFKKLHAICILMKPNESKLTATFRFCINELFTHLHASAAKNILFCFTNARQTLYKPGETLAILKTHLAELKNVKIPLDSSTVFCFDNESFRSLCAWREGFQFTDNEMADFNTSWKITVKEMFRLFKRISMLPTHNVEETVTINNARSVILTIAKPLTDNAKHQMHNLQLINEKIKEIEDCMMEGKDLDDKLYVDQVESLIQEIPQPMTVCTAAKCVTRKKLGNSPNAPEKVDYTTVCHEPCSVEGVQTQSCPNPQLKTCYVFNNPNLLCSQCGCSWDVHIHIRYKMDLVMKKVVDPAVEESIKNCENKQKTAEMFLKSLREKKIALGKEASQVKNECADFALFVNQNSILPYNDAYKEYVDKMIKEAKLTAAEGGASDFLQALESEKADYNAQVKIIKNAQKDGTSIGKTPKEINSMVENMKKAEKGGSVLKEVQKLELISTKKPNTENAVVIKTDRGWFSTFNNVLEGAKSMSRLVLSSIGFGGKSKRK